jgi:hypothetical protein
MHTVALKQNGENATPKKIQFNLIDTPWLSCDFFRALSFNDCRSRPSMDILLK